MCECDSTPAMAVTTERYNALRRILESRTRNEARHKIQLDEYMAETGTTMSLILSCIPLMQFRIYAALTTIIPGAKHASEVSNYSLWLLIVVFDHVDL